MEPSELAKMQQRAKDWNKAVAFHKAGKMTDQELCQAAAKIWGVY